MQHIVCCLHSLEVERMKKLNHQLVAAVHYSVALQIIINRNQAINGRVGFHGAMRNCVDVF